MLAGGSTAAAQTDSPRSGTRAVALDTVVAVADYFADAGMWQTQLVFDTFGSVEVAPGVQASFRPLFWRMKNGTWKVYTPHASLRFAFSKGSNWRVELGRFPSPVGLGMTENRPNLNPAVLWCHRAYYGNVPWLGEGTAPHALISANYPMGALVSTSGDRWDARAAFTDRAPVDPWTAHEGTPRRGNAIVGAGVTPRQGVRIGIATAWGRSGDHEFSQPYRLVNLEGEYAAGYTRVSGEWIRDQFETPSGTHVASGWTLQARQTLTPRLFAHSRISTVSSPAALTADTFEVRDFLSIDTTVGYLVNPEVTIRAGHAAIKGWTDERVDHQIGVSLVWSKRWW
jgi:hypothetical protein